MLALPKDTFLYGFQRRSRDQNSNDKSLVVNKKAMRLRDVDFIFHDQPSIRRYSASIMVPGLSGPLEDIILFKNEEYHREITGKKAREKLVSLIKDNNPEEFLNEKYLIAIIRHLYFLGDFPHGVGTILWRIFQKLGFKNTSKCICSRYALYANFKGPQWCEQNKSIIFGWLEQEAVFRGISYNQRLADLFLSKALEIHYKKTEKSMICS